MKGRPGWVNLGGRLDTEINVTHRELNSDTVTHLSTNRARRLLTSLIEANALSTTPDHHLFEQQRTASGDVVLFLRFWRSLQIWRRTYLLTDTTDATETMTSTYRWLHKRAPRSAAVLYRGRCQPPPVDRVECSTRSCPAESRRWWPDQAQGAGTDFLDHRRKQLDKHAFNTSQFWTSHK